MAVSSNVSVLVKMTGDVVFNEEFALAENIAAPGAVSIQNLASGNNTITVPASANITTKGVTIVPPSSNTQALTLKGINGDTGIAISKTNPTFIAFETAPANFVINAGNTVNDVRFVWS